MRSARLALLVAVIAAALVAVPAALAASRSQGDGTFAVTSVNGSVVVTARGAVWGQVDRGSVSIFDPNPNDGVIKVSGYTTSHPGKDPGTTVYTGSNIHFQIVGGSYRLAIRASEGIDLSAVGVGKATLQADPLATDPGYFARADGKWQPVPDISTTVAFGSSGPVVPTVPTTTTTP